jgi:lipopolysaccharide/colanic/teichoic acid biosynthesis glycosyltransferase
MAIESRSISIMIMASGSRQELLAEVRASACELQTQNISTSQAIEILVMDLSGTLHGEDLGDFEMAQLIPCLGLLPAEARNLGLEMARGEIVCFTDSDCLPLSGWLAALVGPFSDERVAGVKGAFARDGDGLVGRFIQLEHESRYRRLLKQPWIDFVDMYSAAYRRSALMANDGFDERFGRLEEQELAYRLTGRGYRLVFQPEAQVSRQHPSSIGDYARLKAVTGYWKAQVIRLFPDRGMRDSYTPQALKLQIGSLFAAAGLALLSLLNPWLLAGAIVACLLFLISTIPFMTMIWAEDRPVLSIALPMLAARAISLGAGYIWGVFRPAPGLGEQTSTISGVPYLAKRFVDIIGSLAGLAFTCATAPLIWLLIKLDSPGPVLFRQTRIGRGGRPFVLLKYRTMGVDAEERLGELIDLDGLEQPAFKLDNDPRITRAGRFLRRWSLDELPQFLNVLRGEMSLVGPRPEEARIVAQYSDWHRRRLAVKPGMTGPMQVHGRGDLSLDQRVELEIDYIEEYTLWRDMKILVRTIPSVLNGEGAR